MEATLIILVAAATTVGAVELVRREVALLMASKTPVWRAEARAMGALYASVSAVVLWVMVATGSPPTSLAAVLIWLGVMVFLLVADERVR